MCSHVLLKVINFCKLPPTNTAWVMIFTSLNIKVPVEIIASAEPFVRNAAGMSLVAAMGFKVHLKPVGLSEAPFTHRTRMRLDRGVNALLGPRGMVASA